MNHQIRADIHVGILLITLSEKKVKQVMNLISDIPAI